MLIFLFVFFMQTFLWLQENYDYDIHTNIDSSGNNFLHRIAKSSNAARFIEQLIFHMNDESRIDVLAFTRGGFRKHITNALNSDGHIWIEILVNKGNVRALDLALSPHHKFSWDMCLYCSDIIGPLNNFSRQQKNHTATLIINSFHARCEMSQLYSSICHSSSDEKENELFQCDGLSVLCGTRPNLYAEQFIRFYHDWKNIANLNHSVFTTVVKRGYSRIFELFYSVNDAWFWNEEDRIWLNEENDQFIQPEISSDVDSETILIDLTTICIIGESQSWFKHELFEKQMYFRNVM